MAQKASIKLLLETTLSNYLKQVEVPGIEPGSFGIKTGLLRA